MTLVADAPPMDTVAPEAKSVPESVTPVPPDAGPEAGATEKMIRWENSDVLPEGSVAVALRRASVATAAGTVTSKAPVPVPSVETWPDPR